jgi:hypothetical protein
MKSRIEQDHEQISPTRSSTPAAQHMGCYRKQRRQGPFASWWLKPTATRSFAWAPNGGDPDDRLKRQKTMNADAPSPTPAAVRMRRYRKERRLGLHWLRIALDVTDINALIRLGLLKEDQRQDEEALRTAVMSLVYRAEDDLA